MEDIILKAKECLKDHVEIPEDKLSLEDIYEDYLADQNEDKFYYIKDNRIICFDTSATGTDKYWEEEFPIEDYEDANKWLNGELEYSDYLDKKEEDLVRTDIKTIGDKKSVNVSLNTLRDTLNALEELSDKADEIASYTEGISDKFSEETYKYIEDVLDPEYDKIKASITKAEKEEIEKSKKTEEVHEYITITNGKEEDKLDFNSLDFGMGDYYYNGTESGAQIGFVWNEDKGQKYVDHLILTVYVGDEEESDLYTPDKTLKNLTPDEELKITLSDEDYKTYKFWKEMCEKDEFTYWNKLEEGNGIDDLPEEYPEDIKEKYFEYCNNLDLIEDEPLDFRTWVSEEYPEIYAKYENKDNEKVKIQFLSMRVPKEKRDPNLYYYDIRDGEGESYTIEKNVLADNIGAVVATKDILKDKDVLTDKELDDLDCEIVYDLYTESKKVTEKLGFYDNLKIGDKLKDEKGHEITITDISVKGPKKLLVTIECHVKGPDEEFDTKFIGDNILDLFNLDDISKINESKEIKTENFYSKCYEINNRDELKEIALSAIAVADKDKEIIEAIKERMSEDQLEEYKEELDAIERSIYDYVSINYYKMPIEFLREIALNAVYVADDDEAIQKEIDERQPELDDYADEVFEEENSEEKPIGVYTISNNESILVYEIRYGIDDEVVYAYGNDPEDKQIAMIKYDDTEEESRPYFNIGNIKIYFDEIIRTDLTESKKVEEDTLNTNQTIEEYLKENGTDVVDVADDNIDVMVAFVYDPELPVSDNYDCFIQTLAKNVKVEKVITNDYGDIAICNFSDYFKQFNEGFKDIIDPELANYNEDEIYLEIVDELEALVSGFAEESTYKDLVDIISK